MLASAAFRISVTPGGALPGPWVRNSLWSTARAVPSLDLRFADNKSLVDAVTGQALVTFTRASSGTYVGSQGLILTATANEPRFDHNPTTGESLGLLVEEQRTNLLRWSEDSSQWLAPLNATLTQNAATAPDGMATADQMLETTASGLHTQDVTDFVFVQGTTYTYSVFVKSIGGRNFEIGFPTPIFSNRFARFNLSTGIVQGTDAGVTASITAFPNGWYRCSATSVCSTGGGARPSNFINNASFARNYVGEADKGILVWGTQLEAAASPTSYIFTTTSAVTRSADVASITTLGANVRSLFSQFRSPASGTRPLLSLDDNSANNRIELFTSGTDPKLLITSGGVAQADIDAGSVTANVTTKLAARFATDDFAASVSGGASITDASGTLPVTDRIRIGRDQAGNYLNGTIARGTAWNTALPMLPTITQ